MDKQWPKEVVKNVFFYFCCFRHFVFIIIAIWAADLFFFLLREVFQYEYEWGWVLQKEKLINIPIKKGGGGLGVDVRIQQS